MDAHDLFKKLAAGTKLNMRRFRSDAERFQLLRKQPTAAVKNDKVEDKETPLGLGKGPLKRKHEDDVRENASDLTLLRGMTTGNSAGDGKSKKSKTIMPQHEKLKREQEKINEIRNKYRINVTGTRIANPATTFNELLIRYKLPKQLLNNMEECKYTHPTPIQMQAIPIMLEGRHLLACAPTGSGKTAAFLLPIIHRLGGPQKKGFRAVVLCPTRELAKQTYRECTRLSEGYGFRIHIISKINQALSKYGPTSSQKFDILITTPKRLVYLLNQDPPAISLQNVEWLIIDEADKLFEDGPRSFKAQLDEITQACTNENLCRAMFSATNTAVVRKWCRRNLKSHITVTIGQRNTAVDLVEQELLFVGTERGKLVALRNLIQRGISPPVLVFVQSKERAQELFDELIYDGINVDVIHADRTQTQRDNVVRCFREGKIWVLICTELMARGIDFKGVNLVVNYDFPPTAISYIHRIGRTGRAGHRGKATTFFTRQDTAALRSIAAVMRASGCQIPEYMVGLKKCSKKERRKAERTAPAREKILTLPGFKRARRTAKARNQPSRSSGTRQELEKEGGMEEASISTAVGQG
ncbi:hypothetical protein KM043_010464 [Ampulex compressa]|nr:hypothetical protein KM043_010464 [Ampulex compressa]